MKTWELVQQEHEREIGQVCEELEPNVTEDTLFVAEGKPVGFYLRKMPDQLTELCEVANHELNSKRVPKSEMKRSSGMKDAKHSVLQYSTIIGAIPPKPQMRRPYPSISSVHNVTSAQMFISAMLNIAEKSEDLLSGIMPEQYEFQLKAVAENCPDKFRFGRLFTSSISNFNISAPFHRDTGNLQGCVNVIINKKRFAEGGHLHVPDYGLTVNASDNSLLVYPAWRNVHAVTPIKPTRSGGYRNSLVFYPLKAFAAFMPA